MTNRVYTLDELTTGGPIRMVTQPTFNPCAELTDTLRPQPIPEAPAPAQTVVPSKKVSYSQFMSISTLNSGYACSTLVLGSFVEAHYSKPVTFEWFVSNIRSCIKSGPDYGYGPKSEKFAFVFASTVDTQPRTREYLTELGFSTTEGRYNEKNSTTVRLHIIPVDTLIARLKELEEKF